MQRVLRDLRLIHPCAGIVDPFVSSWPGRVLAQSRPPASSLSAPVEFRRYHRALVGELPVERAEAVNVLNDERLNRLKRRLTLSVLPGAATDCLAVQHTPSGLVHLPGPPFWLDSNASGLRLRLWKVHPVERSRQSMVARAGWVIFSGVRSSATCSLLKIPSSRTTSTTLRFSASARLAMREQAS
jgi:hypothetical protein